MAITRRTLLATTPLLAAGVGTARAASGQDRIRIGVLTDMSGPFSDSNGRGSVLAAQMAVDEAGGAIAGRPVEIVSADMGIKVDQAVTIARGWLDDGVAAIVDVPSSAAALAINELIQSKNATFLATGPGSARLTGEACSPNTVHWTFDSYALANTATQAMLATGGKNWFFITADYVFGKDLQAAATTLLQRAGCRVVGAALHPVNNADFASQLLTAQAAQPDVIALANGPTDAGAVLKQAAEFGLMRPGGPRFISLSMTPLDVQATGQDITQGLFMVAPFYWDVNDRTRAFSQRFAAKSGGKMPIFAQAGAYAATRHYLKAVAVAGSVAGNVAVRQMKTLPTDDDAFGQGSIRGDGRKMHSFFLFRVKPSAESKSVQDTLTLVDMIAADKAFRPLGEGGCTMAGL